MSKSVKDVTDSPSSDQTRILLSLWELQGLSQPVKRTAINKWIVRSSEKAKTYLSIFEQLQSDGVIEQSVIKRSVCFKLTPKGLQTLKAGLQQADFAFPGTIIGTKFPNALLHFFREYGSAAPPQESAVAEAAIATDAEFQAALFAAYDAINLRYDCQNLVPIYRLRRELGSRVGHSQFNDWLTQMQADDLVQLMAGEMPDMTPDKHEDSLTLPGGAFRYYVKRL